VCFGHARLLFPQPRNTSDGLKTGPCGNVLRTNTPTVLQPGQTLQVRWEETIDHPGYFLIEYSTDNDQTFTLLANVVDNQVGALPHAFSTNVVVPNITCTACTLRLTQMMTENPALPRPYFSCADIQIGAAGTPPVVNPPPSGQSGQSGSGSQENRHPIGKMAGGCNVAKAAPVSPSTLGWQLALWLLPGLAAAALRFRK